MGHIVSSPLPHSTICSIKKCLLLHVVYGQFAGQVGFPPNCLVTVKTAVITKKKIHTVDSFHMLLPHQGGRNITQKCDELYTVHIINISGKSRIFQSRTALPQHLFSVALNLNHHSLLLWLFVLLQSHLLKVLWKKQNSTKDFWAISESEQYIVWPLFPEHRCIGYQCIVGLVLNWRPFSKITMQTKVF